MAAHSHPLVDLVTLEKVHRLLADAEFDGPRGDSSPPVERRLSVAGAGSAGPAGELPRRR
jgi:hypothetical protein